MSENPTQKNRLQVIRHWLQLFSISRLLRWAVYVGILWGTYSNWHENIDPEDISQRYATSGSHFLKVDGMEVHCRTVGEGSPLLLLHDANSSLHTWSSWTDSLSAQGYKVISVDLPGFGLTGPHPKGSYSAFMYAGFLDSLVERLGLQDFCLVGNGLGAQIAWQYAAGKPARLDKLVLIDVPGFEQAKPSWITLIARTPVANRLLRRISPQYFMRLMLEDVFADNRLVTDSLVQRHFDLYLRTGNRAAFTDRASVKDNRPPVEIIEEIKAQTLILWGAEDTYLSPEHAYSFHQKIRGSLLRIYRNTGHWPQEENPVQSARDVRDFLEGRF
jgi:pimeloyl-ACP methyl ester carboxylesterase